MRRTVQKRGVYVDTKKVRQDLRPGAAGSLGLEAREHTLKREMLSPATFFYPFPEVVLRFGEQQGRKPGRDVLLWA